MTLLDVRNLSVSFDTFLGSVQAVHDISFQVEKGQAVALVGESGCGKSATAQALTQLIPTPPGKIPSGQVLFNERDLMNFSSKDLRRIRGNEISMIFQDPMTSLNPSMRIGAQIAEGLIQHKRLSYRQAYQKSIELLDRVHVPMPEKRVDRFPHELSGGMRQRVSIAIALACHPQLLIADEPTTALDVTVQAQILNLLQELKESLSMSILLITHDLGTVASLCDHVLVMYAGKIVEQGSIEQIFYEAQHPYTRALLQAVPRLDVHKDRPLIPIPGSPPNLLSPPPACPFASRCPHTMKVCEQHSPSFGEHRAACWLHHPLAQQKSIS